MTFHVSSLTISCTAPSSYWMRRISRSFGGPKVRVGSWASRRPIAAIAQPNGHGIPAMSKKARDVVHDVHGAFAVVRKRRRKNLIANLLPVQVQFR